MKQIRVWDKELWSQVICSQTSILMLPSEIFIRKSPLQVMLLFVLTDITIYLIQTNSHINIKKKKKKKNKKKKKKKKKNNKK